MEKYLSKNGLCCGFIGLLALLLWGQTVRFGFVWDDAMYITQNKSIRSLANIPKIFVRREAQSTETSPTSYRPIRTTVYALLYALDGHDEPRPWIFHLANVLSHAVVAMLLFLTALSMWQRLEGGTHLDIATGGVRPSPAAASNGFSERAIKTPLGLTIHVAAPEDGRTPVPISRPTTAAVSRCALEGGMSMAARMAAFLIALGFAVHPVISEVVCWAKCLDDMLAAAFVLASARSLLKWNGGRRGYVAALAWFLLAVFSKDSAVPFALAVFFLLHGFHKLPWRRSAKLTIPFLLVAFFYVAFQRWVMGHLSQCPPLSGSYGQTLINMFPVAPEYLRLLSGIPPFCADYNFMLGTPPYPLLSGRVLGGVFLVLFFGALAAWMWRRPNWRMTAFGFIWIALFLLPVSNLVPMMQYMAERFLYLPLIGFLFALGGVLLNFSRLRLASAVAASAIIIIWAGTSLNRMGIWRDDLTLFVRTELEHPGIKRVEKNAIAAIFALPQIKVWQTTKALSPAQADQIIATLQQARRIYPENDILTTQVGMTEAKIGRWPEAIWFLELAARQNPSSAERWYDLASIYRLAGQPAKAQEACTHALQLNPKYEEALTLQRKLENESKVGNAPKSPAPK